MFMEFLIAFGALLLAGYNFYRGFVIGSDPFLIAFGCAWLFLAAAIAETAVRAAARR
jgi:hypothetical protein